MGLWAVHSVDFFYTDNTQSNLMVLGSGEGQLLPGREGAICDNTDEKTVASSARVHPNLTPPELGKQGSPTDGSQGQPGSVQVIT